MQLLDVVVGTCREHISAGRAAADGAAAGLARCIPVLHSRVALAQRHAWSVSPPRRPLVVAYMSWCAVPEHPGCSTWRAPNSLPRCSRSPLCRPTKAAFARPPLLPPVPQLRGPEAGNPPVCAPPPYQPCRTIHPHCEQPAQRCMHSGLPVLCVLFLAPPP
jgi:hypothetical protein